MCEIKENFKLINELAEIENWLCLVDAEKAKTIERTIDYIRELQENIETTCYECTACGQAMDG